MSTMVRMELDAETRLVSLAVDSNGFIALDGGLETPVFVSLFTDRRARRIDRSVDRRGWWGDVHAETEGDEIGSYLWLLQRENLTPATIRRAQLYAEQALAWLIADGLAKTVTVVASSPRKEILLLRVDITRPDGEQWSAIWDHHGRLVQGAI